MRLSYKNENLAFIMNKVFNNSKTIINGSNI
jgi:hypothetical protein